MLNLCLTLVVVSVPSAPMYTTVHTITNTTAVVDWSRPQEPNGIIVGYRLYFLNGNKTEVKTIKSKDPRLDFRLTDLRPASLYYVWIKAFTWKTEGESSSKLSPGQASRSESHAACAYRTLARNRSKPMDHASPSAAVTAICIIRIRGRKGV